MNNDVSCFLYFIIFGIFCLKLILTLLDSENEKRAELCVYIFNVILWVGINFMSTIEINDLKNEVETLKNTQTIEIESVKNINLVYDKDNMKIFVEENKSVNH